MADGRHINEPDQPEELEQPDQPDQPEQPERPVFDKAAARQRYRATMRGPFMRSMYVVLALVLLTAWGLGVAAVLAKDVERLPNHDLTVPPSRCLTCHTQQNSNAPQMPHVAFPSCGFCHRQSPPETK